MSAAAAASVKHPTQGWSQIPNSLIENQLAFTRAEFALALIVLRRGDGKPLSDQTWKDWTGLEPRLKKYAIDGLKAKGLEVEGRGNDAKYTFARDRWDAFVRQLNPKKFKARTVGRAVDPKPGAKVHEECRARGCAMLAAQGPQLVGSPEGSTLNLQPVANCAGQEPARPPQPAVDPSGRGDSVSSPLVVISNPQRVAKTAQDIWVKTLAALQALFPLVGVDFLLKLVAVVRAVCFDVSDSELADAIGFAWQMKHKRQQSEALFLYTVPNAVLAKRREKAARQSREPDSELPEDLRGGDMVTPVAEALRGLGAPFAAHLAEVVSLRKRSELAEKDLIPIEDRIIQTGLGQLTEQQIWAIEERVEAELKPYRQKLWSKGQMAEVGKQIRDREVLAALGIPRLCGLLYA
jgi:hypothetical protein